MLKGIGCLAQSLVRARGGNATMMVGLGLPALIGAMGYGVDTAQWYMWQRELQHSVDQAAIGGAWAMARDEAADYATRARQEFYANQDVTADFDSPPTVRLANFQGGTNNSVEVIATATRQLPFTSVLLNAPTTISARAQARFQQGAGYTACLITIKKTGTTFQIGGNANVDAKCGLGALSCDPDAIVIDGSATVVTNSISTCGTANVPDELKTVVTSGAGELVDEYADIPIPQPTASMEPKTETNYCKGDANSKGGSKAVIATLSPGIYVGGYTAKCNTTFTSGVYFIDGGTLDLSTNATVIGEKVLFVLRKGAELKLGGQGGAGSIDLTPMEKETDFPTEYREHADRLSQILFIEDKGTETDTSSHHINGNSQMNIEGIIYLPNGDVQVNGDSGTTSDLCFQISAYTLDIRGGAYLRTLCQRGTNLGNSAAIVRLVA